MEQRYRDKRDIVRARSRAWYIANKKKHIAEGIRRRRERLYPAATRPCPELCEISGCGFRATRLDHDHKTNKFRGWVCHKHNAGMGMLGDDIAGLEAALDYLRRNS